MAAQELFVVKFGDWLVRIGEAPHGDRVVVAGGEEAAVIGGDGDASNFCIVRAEDVDRLMSGARAFAERDGRMMIHLNRVGYRLDGLADSSDPRGMAAHKLAADIHTIAADEAPVRNLLLSLEHCYLSARALVATPYASAIAATSEEERRLGVTCIDIGAGTASVAAFAEGHFIHAAVIPVGGQQITVRGLAGTYDEEYLPLYGGHQGFNAALAIAAVEALIGGASQAIAAAVLTEGLAQATAPGRLQLVGIAPTVLVDAAHNPHGVRALVAALREKMPDESVLVVAPSRLLMKATSPSSTQVRLVVLVVPNVSPLRPGAGSPFCSISVRPPMPPQ